jgi:hypothetical protein
MEDQPFSELLDEMLKIARASVSGFLLTPRERRRMNRLLFRVNLNRVILVLFKLLRNPLAKPTEACARSPLRPHEYQQFGQEPFVGGKLNS